MCFQLPREVIEKDVRFTEFTNILAKRKDPPYLLYLDKGFLEITLNHICNLKYMPNSIERLAVVSFDAETEREFSTIHPYIPTVTLDFSVVRNAVPEDLENHRYVIYQLVLMMRSHIASILSRRGISFWSMQQVTFLKELAVEDSIWTENFVSMDVEQHYPDSLLIFDTVGNDQVPIYRKLMPGWICGSTFFVRASPVTAGFFEKPFASKYTVKASYILIIGGTNYDSPTVARFLNYDVLVRCATISLRKNAAMVGFGCI
ncbi:unnamed protein product [Strongylus vulgaris]|uniref:Nucleotide-diphospho-sugar transferase domain-containing protein n=1 Tax=Strongylus vulgaris TaxID=40348 RepID=A0A3P7I814_STRVU|nr:unnamed protein product [Strongylus vulgaris]